MTLGSAGASDPASEALKDPENKLGMTRSASSPRLSSETENKVTLTQILYGYCMHTVLTLNHSNVTVIISKSIFAENSIRK